VERFIDEIKDIISTINYDEYNSKTKENRNENSSRNAEILFSSS
jgi:hypothetical protein